MEPLILGSQSPRRKEILSYFKLPFVQVPSSFDEESVPFGGDPQKYASKISSSKAQVLAQRYPDNIILTADTNVYFEGKIYGKPRNDQEAIETLSQLVDRWHTVYTSVTVAQGAHLVSQVEATRVLFNPLNSHQIEQYIKHTNWADKAGGYAIQMAGGLIVRKIDGCYYNVMGLPINTVEKLLKTVGIELWDYL